MYFKQVKPGFTNYQPRLVSKNSPQNYQKNSIEKKLNKILEKLPKNLQKSKERKNSKHLKNYEKSKIFKSRIRIS